MSAISNQLPSSGSGSSSASTFSSLTPSDFVQFMITQLQNQDPLNPTDPNAMLQQISEIGQLQSSDTLTSDLTTMTQQNQVASSASMIGQAVIGTDTRNNTASGVVSAVQISNGSVNLQLDSGDIVPLSSVTAIANPADVTGS